LWKNLGVFVGNNVKEILLCTEYKLSIDEDGKIG
jgi:hypothetical protein